MSRTPARTVIVLSRVQDSRNVGSVCRAMKTMGFGELRLAAAPEYDDDQVRALAAHSAELYEGAIRYSTLAEALADTALSAGFTRRTGRKRSKGNIPLETFVSEHLTGRSGTIALVFGNEADGLDDAELSLCTVSVHIPTNPDCPSLNVSQAVQIACYALSRAATARQFPQHRQSALPLARSDIDMRISGIAGDLRRLGMFRQSDSSHATDFLRDLCERAALNEDEIEYLGTLLNRSAALARLHRD